MERNGWWWQAVLGLMAMGGPDGLPLRREFAARRAHRLQGGPQLPSERT
jgi:hypothetical protein